MRKIAFENGTPNEVDRLVIELGTLVQQGVAQDDPERWVLSESNIWILHEEAGPGDATRPRWRVFEPSNPITATWRKFGELCAASGPAVACEFGRRLVNGRRCKAEDYIALWRSAKKISLVEAIARGMLIVANIQRDLAALRVPTDKVYVAEANAKALGDLAALAANPALRKFLVHESQDLQQWTIPILEIDTYRLYRALRHTAWNAEYGGLDSCAFEVHGHAQMKSAADPVGDAGKRTEPVVRDLFEVEA